MDVEDHIRDVLDAFPVALPNIGVISRSISLHSRYSLSHWDGMLIAACIEAGVDKPYSEDLVDGMTYDLPRQHFLNFLPLPQGQGSLRPTR